MKSIVATANQGDYSVLSIYFGIDALTRLCKTGTLEQKHALSKQIQEHDVLAVIYDVRVFNCLARLSDKNILPQRLQNHPYFIVRIVAADFIAIFSKGSAYFAAQPDMAITAEIIFQCCQACIVGPGQAEEEMKDPSRRWTTRYICGGKRRVSSANDQPESPNSSPSLIR